MEQQPFESQLALSAKSGANGQGKCRGLPPTAFPSSSQSFAAFRARLIFVALAYSRPLKLGCAHFARAVSLLRATRMRHAKKVAQVPSRSILDRQDLSLLIFDLFASSEETQT